MKRISGKYNLSKDDPHYKRTKQTRTISPREWVTKINFESKQSRYIIRFRSADRVMKITQLVYSPESPNLRKRILVVAPGNEEYEKFYGYYKIAKRIKKTRLCRSPKTDTPFLISWLC